LEVKQITTMKKYTEEEIESIGLEHDHITNEIELNAFIEGFDTAQNLFIKE